MYIGISHMKDCSGWLYNLRLDIVYIKCMLYCLLLSQFLHSTLLYCVVCSLRSNYALLCVLFPICHSCFIVCSAFSFRFATMRIDWSNYALLSSESTFFLNFALLSNLGSHFPTLNFAGFSFYLFPTLLYCVVWIHIILTLNFALLCGLVHIFPTSNSSQLCWP